MPLEQFTFKPNEFESKLKAGLRTAGLPSFDFEVLLACIERLVIAQKEDFKNITLDESSKMCEYVRKSIKAIETTTNSTIDFPGSITSNMAIILATNPGSPGTKRVGPFTDRLNFSAALSNSKIVTAFSVKKYVYTGSMQPRASSTIQKAEQLNYDEFVQKKLDLTLGDFLDALGAKLQEQKANPKPVIMSKKIQPPPPVPKRPLSPPQPKNTLQEKRISVVTTSNKKTVKQMAAELNEKSQKPIVEPPQKRKH